MKFHLHIGSYKTGTTSIQQHLKRNRAELIERRWLYPVSGCMNNNAHHPIPYALLNKVDNASIEQLRFLIRDVVDEAKHNGSENIILSSEVFFSLSNTHILQLQNLLQDHEVKVYAYLRRQDEFFHSFFMQCVKQNTVRYSRTAESYNGFNKTTELGDYHNKLGAWESAFGEESIVARIYKRSELPDGVIPDFCSLMGIGFTDTSVRTRSNSSIETELIEYLRVLNSLDISKDDHEFILANLNKISFAHKDKAMFTNRPFISQEKAEEIMELYTSSNELLKQKYFPESDDLFDESSLHKDSVAKWTPPILRNETLAKLHCWLWLESRNSDRKNTSQTNKNKSVDSADGKITAEAGSEMIQTMNA